MLNHKPEAHNQEATVQPELKNSTEAKALAESLTKALNTAPKEETDPAVKAKLMTAPAPRFGAFGGCSY